MQLHNLQILILSKKNAFSAVLCIKIRYFYDVCYQAQVPFAQRPSTTHMNSIYFEGKVATLTTFIASYGLTKFARCYYLLTLRETFPTKKYEFSYVFRNS